jgi:RNA polymerase sigma-70 factor (ECF subfamily)
LFKDIEDRELMMKVKEGDEDAFRVLFERYRGKLMRYIFGMIGNYSVTEDIVQEVFLKLFLSRKRYKPVSSFRAYIYRIAHNTCVNFLKSRRYKELSHLSIERVNGNVPPSFDESGEERERIEILKREMKNLPEKQRTAIQLALLEGMSYEEIAQVIGCSYNAAKILLFRAKEKLMERLRDEKM